MDAPILREVYTIFKVVNRDCLSSFVRPEQDTQKSSSGVLVAPQD